MTALETDPFAGEGAGVGASIKASLDLHLGRVGGELAALRRDWARLAETPVYAPRGRSGAAANNTLTVSLGGPVSGRAWHVRSVAVGGVTPTTTAAGIADLFVVAGGAANAVGSLLDWRDRASSLPSAAFYGLGELHLGDHEKLVVIFTGATNGQTYAASALINEYQPAAVAQIIGT